MLLNCGAGEDSWESLGLQGDPSSPFWRRSALGVLCKDWCWRWNSNTLVTSCEELTQWKRLGCWEGLGAGGEGDDRGWDGRWHHRLNGHEFEWTLGVGDGQGGLVCCNSWGHKELDMTEQLNWTDGQPVSGPWWKRVLGTRWSRRDFGKWFSISPLCLLGFPGGSEVKNLPADAGEANLIPVWGRSPGVGNATLLILTLPLTPNP